MKVLLRKYENRQKTMCRLIQGFWFTHNGDTLRESDCIECLGDWTKEGHCLYFICLEEKEVGFVHLAARGVKIDWLEDLYVDEMYRNQGIGREALRLAEEIVKTYSDSMYIEVAARNEAALRLYRNLGYDCLNTVTVRRDFRPEEMQCIRKETILDKEFEVRTRK